MIRFLQFVVVLRQTSVPLSPVGSPWSQVKQAGTRYCMFFVSVWY